MNKIILFRKIFKLLVWLVSMSVPLYFLINVSIIVKNIPLNFTLVGIWLVLLICSLSIIFITHPIYILIFLIWFCLISTVTLINTGFTFFPLIFTLLYVGAISVLFIFIIILLNVDVAIKPIGYLAKPTFIFLILFIIFIKFIYFQLIFSIKQLLFIKIYVIKATYRTEIDINSFFADMYHFTTLLYKEHGFLVITAIFVLLAASLNAIHLAFIKTKNNSLSSIRRNGISWKTAIYLFFFSKWTLQLWISTLVGSIIVYIMVFSLIKKFALFFNQKFFKKLIILSSNQVALLILFDFLLNFAIGIFFVKHNWMFPDFTEFLSKCPIALSPIIMVLEIVLMFIYSIFFKK